MYSRRCLYANQFYQPYFYIVCKRILHIKDIATTKYLPDPSDIFSSNMAPQLFSWSIRIYLLNPSKWRDNCLSSNYCFKIKFEALRRSPFVCFQRPQNSTSPNEILLITHTKNYLADVELKLGLVDFKQF